ncbi:MAG: hypothetical protein Q3972_07610 [Corynebacterium sp.]|nr:hypothetical protein [Corynebacterium sp.]
MPPKVTDTQPTQDAMHAVEAATAEAARHIVATYAEDFFDFATLSCMLGIEIEGLRYRRLAAEFADTEAEEAPKTTKKTTKKSAKKTAKKTAKKSAKKTAKKTAKKATKATAKKTTAKATTKATKKTTKKTTKKSTSAASE